MTTCGHVWKGGMWRNGTFIRKIGEVTEIGIGLRKIHGIMR